MLWKWLARLLFGEEDVHSALDMEKADCMHHFIKVINHSHKRPLAMQKARCKVS